MNNNREVKRRIARKIEQASACYMSNAKWRKFFNSLHSYEGQIGGLSIKFVKDDRVFEISMPGPFKDEEKQFGDEMPYPYGPFKEIEYVKIPKEYPNPHSDPKRDLPDLSNDLDDLKSYLESIAKFPIFEYEDCIRIVGYEWCS
jgi:hypothetical protein